MDDQEAAKMKQMAGMMLMMSMMFALLGIILEISAYVQEFGTFAPLQEKYWAIDKVTRDAAPAGSALASQLAEIKNFPPRLILFKLTGIASILVGIFLTLVIISKRMGGLPDRLGFILKK